MKRITSVAVICAICATILMSGCLETTTVDEYGTATHNVLTGEGVMDIDFYVDGFHWVGRGVYDGEGLVSGSGLVDGFFSGAHVTGTWSIDPTGEMIAHFNIDGYIDGQHVTGTMTNSDGDICCDCYMKVDRHCAQGYHNTGYKTLKGCGDDVEWYSVLTATKDGYKTQYLNGYDDAEWRT